MFFAFNITAFANDLDVNNIKIESPVIIMQLEKPIPKPPDTGGGNTKPKPEKPDVGGGREINVTVPTQLPTVSTGKNILIGSFGSIKNNGTEVIKLKAIKIRPAKKWKLIKGDTPKSKIGNGKRIGLKINEVPNDINGNFNVKKFKNIYPGENELIKWSGIYNISGSSKKSIHAATVTFVVGY